MILEEEDLPKVREYEFHGKKYPMYLQPDGSYIDSVTGATIPSFFFDPKFCGILPLETGKGDPWHNRFCAAHDDAFNKAKLGYHDSTQDNLDVLKKATLDIGTGMLEGAFLLFTGPAYWLIGGVGGFLLQQIREIGK